MVACVLGDRLLNQLQYSLVPPWDLPVAWWLSPKSYMNICVCSAQAANTKGSLPPFHCLLLSGFKASCLCIDPLFLFENPLSFLSTTKAAFHPKMATEVALFSDIDLFAFSQSLLALWNGGSTLCVMSTANYLHRTSLPRGQTDLCSFTGMRIKRIALFL